jgi:hypothetical protein
MDVFMGIVILALIIEKIAEGIKAIISPAELPAWVWFTLTAIIGVGLCVLFAVDLFGALGFTSGIAAAEIVGQIITGVAVGCGSNFIHDLISKLKS